MLESLVFQIGIFASFILNCYVPKMRHNYWRCRK